jgi:hypothetical protein
VLGLLAAVPAILVQLDFLGNQLLVLTGPVIYVLADPAGQLYQSIL